MNFISSVLLNMIFNFNDTVYNHNALLETSAKTEKINIIQSYKMRLRYESANLIIFSNGKLLNDALQKAFAVQNLTTKWLYIKKYIFQNDRHYSNNHTKLINDLSVNAKRRIQKRHGKSSNPTFKLFRTNTVALKGRLRNQYLTKNTLLRNNVLFQHLSQWDKKVTYYQIFVTTYKKSGCFHRFSGNCLRQSWRT